MDFSRNLSDYNRDWMFEESRRNSLWSSHYLWSCHDVSGIIDIVIFAAGHDYMAGSGWFLADGILTVLMSLFILGNGWFTAMTISFILGMWLIFSGITKLVNSFDLQKLGVRGWGLVYGTWILLTVIGFCLSHIHLQVLQLWPG